MEGYGQFCPISKALEVVGTRWTPLVLRELLYGSRHFSEIQRGVPLMSRSLLAKRLKELEDAGLLIVTQKDRGRGHEYRLTDAGLAVRPVLEALGDWGGRYASSRIGPEDCDPALLFWAMRRYADRSTLPLRRFIVRFEFRNLPPHRRSFTTWWLVWDHGELSHCLENPGFEVDLVVNAAVDALVKVWMGNLGLRRTISEGLLRLEGAPDAQSNLVRMLDLQSEPCAKAFSYPFIRELPALSDRALGNQQIGHA